MFENYRKKLFCIKYNINYKKNQEVKPNRLICVKFYYTTKETSKYRCEKQKWAGRNATVRPGDNAGIPDDFIAKKAASGKPKPPYYDISSITQPLSP